MKKHKRYKRGHNQHHRLPRSRGGNGGSNISHVPANLHDLWHQMFGNMIADEVARALQGVWLEEGYEVIIRNKGGSVCQCEKCQKYFDTNLVCPVCRREEPK